MALAVFTHLNHSCIPNASPTGAGKKSSKPLDPALSWVPDISFLQVLQAWGGGSKVFRSTLEHFYLFSPRPTFLFIS